MVPVLVRISWRSAPLLMSVLLLLLLLLLLLCLSVPAVDAQAQNLSAPTSGTTGVQAQNVTSPAPTPGAVKVYNSKSGACSGDGFLNADLRTDGECVNLPNLPRAYVFSAKLDCSGGTFTMWGVRDCPKRVTPVYNWNGWNADLAYSSARGFCTLLEGASPIDVRIYCNYVHVNEDTPTDGEQQADGGADGDGEGGDASPWVGGDGNAAQPGGGAGSPLSLVATTVLLATAVGAVQMHAV